MSTKFRSTRQYSNSGTTSSRASRISLITDPEDKEPEFAPATVSTLRLMRDPDLPIPLRALNHYHGAKKRLYRPLLPPELLERFDIDPITWKGPEGEGHVKLVAPSEKGLAKIEAYHQQDDRDPFAYLELVDNNFNGINVVLVRCQRSRKPPL
jgi:hypothetical protein